MGIQPFHVDINKYYSKKNKFEKKKLGYKFAFLYGLKTVITLCILESHNRNGMEREV